MNVFQYHHLDDLKKWLCERHDELHLMNTLYQPRMCLVNNDGTMYRSQGVKGLCVQLNEYLNGDYDIQSSYSVGRNRGTVFYGLEKETKEPIVQEQKEEEKVVVSEKTLVVEESVEPSPSLISLETEEVSDKKEPDWKWIESLGTDKSAKEELDAYATDEFNISLNRTMKFSNMVKKFKEELAKQ